MQLDERQKQIVTQWIRDGLKLSEIQNRLAADLGLNLTYMEVRLLVDDLKLVPKDAEPPKAPPTLAAPAGDAKAPAKPQEPPAEEDELPEESEPPLSQSHVKVSVDQVTRPGALVSGAVTFSDGQAGQWWVDQMGRMGVAPKQKGYRPTDADLEAFQTELQRALQHLGF